MSILGEGALEPVLGPYNVVDLLRPRKGARIKPTLRNVIFSQRNVLVGLDMVDNKRLRDRGPVLIAGTLMITDENKVCLSEQGTQRLCNDLSRRSGRLDSRSFDRPGFKAKVKVRGVLFGEPLGLDSSGDLIIVTFDTSTTVTLEHEFIIRSLHVQTYALSRRYLSKWSVLREINSIVNRNEHTKIKARTPRWLVTKFLEANAEHFHDNNKNQSLTLRHVHRSEVYNLLAHHHRWLSQKLFKVRLVDKSSWKDFVEEVEARTSNRIANQDQNPDDCNNLDELWPEEDELIPDNDEVPARNEHLEFENDIAEHDYQHTYRQVGGIQATLGQSQLKAEKAMVVTNSDVLAAIPDSLHFGRPIFPAGSSEWRCPVDSCDYAVVLRKAYGQSFKWMNEDDRKFLRLGCWGPDNDRAVELFYDIVEHHFYDHLKGAGIRHFSRQYIGQDAMNNPQYELVELTGPNQTTEDDNSYKFEWARPHHH